MLHCAVCFNNRDEFYQQAYVALLSCFANTREEIHLHMVVDKSVTPHLHHFQSLCEEYGHTLSVYPPPEIPNDVRGLFRELHRYTDASLYRLCFHEIIEADTLVYFDCDIVFERDIADLADSSAYGESFNRAFMVATHDEARVWRRRKKRYYLDRLNIREDRYFNSGVLLLNLKNLREAGPNVFWEQYRRLAPLWATLPFDIFDQDLLNIMLSQDEERLILRDASFNYEVCLHDRRFLPLEDLSGKILHFAALKPWMKFFPAHLAYWKYYTMSPWKDSTFQRISQRIQDPTDKWMASTLSAWKHPKLHRWLVKLGAALDCSS